LSASVIIGLSSQLRFFQGGRCNVTLGGGRSILLSYWCIQHIFYPNILYLSRKSGTFFTSNRIYCPVVIFWKGETDMYLRFDPMADLDDLIFDEDAGGPSER
ncbi:MAG: hypothetical protein ACI3V4_10125, partial [Faecousia sp.]